MKILARSILVVGALIVSTQAVYPCTCAAIGQRRAFKKASAVFIGRVVEINPYQGEPFEYGPFPISQSVKLKVEKSWKGAEQPEIIVLSEKYFGWCGGFNFQAGDKYLLYAFSHDGKLVTHSVCTRSSPLSEATGQVKRLNNFWFRLFARTYPF